MKILFRIKPLISHPGLHVLYVVVRMECTFVKIWSVWWRIIISRDIEKKCTCMKDKQKIHVLREKVHYVDYKYADGTESEVRLEVTAPTLHKCSREETSQRGRI